MRDFRAFHVWKKAHQITLDTYRLTSDFPQEERFGLSSQMRRAAASIPANIAEGSGRHGNAELTRFLWIAMGSASELEYHFLLCRDLDLLDTATYQEIQQRIIEVRRMLDGLIQRLAQNS